MRTLLTAFFTFFCALISFSQNTRLKSKKYQSLLWEISGKGLTKPSYLFGTMHVSSKMVFNLSDTFYLCLRNADVVALENDPGEWQEDFSKYDMDYYPQRHDDYLADYLSINSLKMAPYEKMVGSVLYYNPSIINNFLYRSYSDASSDFEEDTYLDLYIYQAGKKWNKKICGVENFDESIKLMKEAYADAAKENRKEKSYDEDFSNNKLGEAYRTGNLDLLDTINKFNSSAAFNEKFIYKRNDIQANSIDSILKTKATLFVGVGAAHLPGDRGVIELLRKKGYKLRPIKMTTSYSRHKDEIEKIRVPVTFSKQTSADGFYSVNVPGKLYSFSKQFGGIEQRQYADMMNGSYYMVSRVATNAALWGHTTETIHNKIDSMLYENIPGKILSRQAIVKNGYKGFDIVSRTRRGDCQRYNIFVTPFEVLVFKMSGNNDYVKLGKEADLFFNSIELKESVPQWKKYTSPVGGFEVEMPHQPIVVNNGEGWIFGAYDKMTATNFEVIRNDIHNVQFVEEDSFDLNLLEESFGTSECIEKQISRKFTSQDGHAALEAKYTYKDGSAALVKFIIQGPHYYTLIANAKTENSKMNQFMHSFSLKPLTYKESKKQSDTTMGFTVTSPVAIEKPRKPRMYPDNLDYMYRDSDDDSLIENASYKNKVIVDDSTGEKIHVSYYKPPRYFYGDTSWYELGGKWGIEKDDLVYRKRNEYLTPAGMKVFDYELGDSSSSRIIKAKVFNKESIRYVIVTEGDTLTKWSPFVTDFFATFKPSDTVQGMSKKEKKNLFFSDYFSSDTLLHQRAVKNIHQPEFDSSDFVMVKKMIEELNWKEKKYPEVKNKLIYQLSQIKTHAASDYLKQLYYTAEDTVDMQHAILFTLLDQETDYSYQQFRDIMVKEPPILDFDRGDYDSYNDEYTAFVDHLQDSLLLTKTIFKDLLPLLKIDDYKRPIMEVLITMLDSNMISTKECEPYLPQFLLEARQEIKKQLISEKYKAINKAQADNKWDSYRNYRERMDEGNTLIVKYAELLMPFWGKNAAVPPLIQQVLGSNDKKLKYDIAFLLLDNKKPIPDTLLNFLAGMDQYRYPLYAGLSKKKLLDRFPNEYNTHIALAKSRLYSQFSNNKLDSIVYMDRLPAQYKEKKGFVYFFKYKEQKDDDSWKIAMAGLVPSDPKVFEFECENTSEDEDHFPVYEYNLSEVTSTKLDEDEPVKEQFEKALKKQLYSKRKSARYFREEDSYNRGWNTSVGDYRD